MYILSSSQKPFHGKKYRISFPFVLSLGMGILDLSAIGLSDYAHTQEIGVSRILVVVIKFGLESRKCNQVLFLLHPHPQQRV